jgi:cbb3-type cytochrome oxidase subunit 3
MKLSDIMANAGLSIYAEVALVLFMLAFLGILWWVFRRANTARWNAAAQMPLDDVHPQQPRTREG